MEVFMYFLLTLLLISCNDYSIKEAEQSKPELVVYPEDVKFGHLESEVESEVESGAIQCCSNRGIVNIILI